jgi:putative peptidoglycan lipid II flippase
LRDREEVALNQKVLKNATAIGVATLISRILGLVREQVFAVLFGAGNFTDAFNVAFRIPNLLRNLFAEGAMSAALVPTFIRVRVEEGEARAWQVASRVFGVLLLVVSLLTLLGMAFAPAFVSLYASAFKHIPGKFEITVQMTRTMFPYFPMVVLSAAFMGILNACGVFFLPALASALFNLATIVFGVIFAVFVFQNHPQLGFFPVEGMAVGVLFGGIVQAFCQYPKLRSVGFRWRSSRVRSGAVLEVSGVSNIPWLQDPAFKRMLLLIAPGVVGLAATQVSILINTILATTRGPGAVSWLSYAFRLMQFPIGLFGASFATATLPGLSHSWANRDFPAVKDTLVGALRHVFAINLPASAGLAFLGVPIVALIFQYGHFSPEDTWATSMALAMYAIGLTCYSAVKVLVPACYAMGNSRLPVLTSVLSIALALALNLLLVGPLGFLGLALGTSLGAVLNMVLLILGIRTLLLAQGVQLSLKSVLRPFVVQLLIALVMGGVCWMTNRGLNSLFPESDWILDYGRKSLFLLRSVKVFFLIGEGIGIVVGLARAFGIADTTEAFDFFVKKLKNKLSPGKT